MTNGYNIQDNEKLPIIFNGLWREGLHLKQTLSDEEQEKCKTSKSC